MSRSVLSDDLERVKGFLIKRGIVSEPNLESCKKPFAVIHRCVYTYALFEYCMRSKNCAANLLSEMKSDAFQVIPVCLMGYRKLSYLLLRALIENSLRYVYYYHHEIEYANLDRFPKQYTTIKELSKYIQQHPHLRGALKQYDFATELTDKYFELSRVVHGATIKNMQLARGLSTIVYNESLVSEIADQLAGITKLVVFLICRFHRDRFTKLRDDFRRVMISNMPSDTKRKFFSLR